MSLGEPYRFKIIPDVAVLVDDFSINTECNGRPGSATALRFEPDVHKKHPKVKAMFNVILQPW